MDFSIFKDRLNYLFEGRGLGVNALAADIGISAPTLSRYLSGKRAPDLPYVILISDYFKVSIDWLLGLEDGREEIREDVRDIANLYSIASLDDRKVIHAVLDKYRKADDNIISLFDRGPAPEED